jgi:hypothetical protein
MEILVDYERAKQVFGTLLDAEERKLPPYDKIAVQSASNLPKDLEWGGSEHALLIWQFCAYMRGKINSATAIQSMSRLWEKDRSIFNPDRFGSAKDEKAEALYVQGLLESTKLRFNAEEISRHWVFNSRKLHKYWKGTPTSFYEEAKTYDELCVILIGKKKNDSGSPNGFLGFQHKMASMLTYFLVHAEIVPPFSHPVPVDFHILRVLVEHEILSVRDQTAGTALSVLKLSTAARALTLRYLEETGADPLKLADALWYLSRSFCRSNPGNASRVGRYKARSTPIESKKVQWTNGAGTVFKRTCGQCPVQGTCKWNIPSSSYYIQGKLLVRGARTSPLDLFAQSGIRIPHRTKK